MGPPPTWNPIPTFSDAPVGLQLQRREVQQSGHKSKLVPSVAGRLPPFHVPPCHIPCDRNIPKSTSHHSQRLSPCSRPTESSKICKHVQYFPKKAEIYPASPQASCTSTMAFRLLHAPPHPMGFGSDPQQQLAQREEIRGCAHEAAARDALRGPVRLWPQNSDSPVFAGFYTSWRQKICCFVI